MKKLIFFALCCILFVSLLLPVFAASATVMDDAELLNAAAEARIAESATDPNGLRFYLLTQEASARDDIPSDNRMASLCGITQDDAAVVLLVSVVNGLYYYDMYTYNDADDMFSNSDVDTVLDAPAVYDNLKAGRIEQGATAFFAECRKISLEHAEALARRERRAPLVALIIGVAVGLLTGGGAVLGVFLYYRKKQHGESYPLDRYAKLHLTESSDRFVGSYVTRTRVQSSSSSGGGGGISGGHRGGR